MVSAESTSGRLFARDVVAYTDVELDKYLQKRHHELGAATVTVEDPQNLSKSFIQRLKDRARYASNVDPSTPIDLDQVTSRLLEISSGQNTSLRPQIPSDSRASSVETLPPVPTEVYESERYKKLVEDGARPLYPVDRIDEIARDPFSHWDMLRPWLDYPPDFKPGPDKSLDWDAFKGQYNSWLGFRRWQVHNRREGPPQHVESEAPYGPVDGAFNVFVTEFRRAAPNYTEAMRKLLADYGFTRSFQLHEDPAQQDNLTTWIEYLGYEYSVQHRYNRQLKQMQPAYDRAWKTLVDAKVLRPFETEEYLCNIKSAFQHQSEEDQAAAAAKSAKSGQDTASASLKLIRRRNDLVTEFKVAARNYLRTKKEERCHGMRASWILEQVPLVEAELQERGLIKTGPDTPRAMKRQRRDLEGGEGGGDGEADRSIKKQRRDPGGSGSLPHSQTSSVSQKKRLQRSHDAAADDTPPSKRSEQNGPDLGSRIEVPDSADAEWAGASWESEHTEATSSDADKRVVVGIVGQPSPRASNPDGRLLRMKSTGHAAQSSTSAKPLRRSARIAALQKAKARLTPPAPGASESLSPRTGRGPTPLSITTLRIPHSSVPANKRRRCVRQGSRGVIKATESARVDGATRFRPSHQRGQVYQGYAEREAVAA